MAIIDSVLAAFDAFMLERERRLQQLFGQPTKEITYFKNEPKQRPVALFGASPDGFALDWVTYRAPQVKPFGPVPLESHENISGFVRPDAQPLIPPEKPLLDAVISDAAERKSEQTDQKPVVHSGSPVTKWDGVVRNHVPKKGLQAVRSRHDVTEGDKAEKDQKTWGFDFRA